MQKFTMLGTDLLTVIWVAWAGSFRRFRLVRLTRRSRGWAAAMSSQTRYPIQRFRDSSFPKRKRQSSIGLPRTTRQPSTFTAGGGLDGTHFAVGGKVQQPRTFKSRIGIHPLHGGSVSRPERRSV